MEEENNVIAEPEENETVSGNDPGDTEPTQPEPDEEKEDKPAPEKPGHGQDHDGENEGNAGQTGQPSQQPDYTEMFADALAGLEQPPDRTDELTERLDEVIQLLTPTEEKEEPAAHSELSVPPSGYADYGYPVNVTYGITTSTGYSTYVSMKYDSADAFRSGFEKMETDVAEGNLQSFYVRYVYGTGEDGLYNQLLYDSENPVAVPDPEEPEENETAALLLSHLEGINSYLADMAAADVEYYEACTAYREQMLELQAAQTATTIFLCVGLFFLAGMAMVRQFFGRIK
ncbi:MAG: hypothetical protein HDR04_06330 [Lachnospiraceae bacterium]|nr:hypothetical protein [Lachnospiraceae bacterium]